MAKLIGRKMARELCETKAKKVSEASIQKAQNDNLSQLFKTFPLFAFRPQVLEMILLVSIQNLKTLNLKNPYNLRLFSEKNYHHKRGNAKSTSRIK